MRSQGDPGTERRVWYAVVGTAHPTAVISASLLRKLHHGTAHDNSGSRHSGFSRRDFLRGSGAAAAAAATRISRRPPPWPRKKERRSPADRRRSRSTSTANQQQVKVEPRTTLLEALRYQLDLTGAKPICTDGSSGGATVLVDGKPMQANTMLAMQAVGKKITTVESLAKDAVPAAFVECDAQQCGFCTPGFVVGVRAFLNPNPRRRKKKFARA